MTNHIDKTNPNHIILLAAAASKVMDKSNGITYVVHTCTRRKCRRSVTIDAMYKSHFNCPDCGKLMKRSVTQPV